MAVKLNLIAAVCENMGIGHNGELPWRLKFSLLFYPVCHPVFASGTSSCSIRKELSYFSRMTKTTEDKNKKNVVVMGRKTWESIPEKMRPLPGRVNILLSRQLTDIAINDVTICCSFASAIEYLSSPPLCNRVEKVWIIGGSSVYKEAMQSPLCHRIYLTRILKYYDCDAFLPDIPASFVRVKDSEVPEEKQEENDLEYYHEVYEKQEKVVNKV